MGPRGTEIPNVPGTAEMLVNSGCLGSCRPAKWDQKRARRAATVKITTPQEMTDKPVITAADWPIDSRSSTVARRSWARSKVGIT
jgi:hypothetical protein